MDGKHVATVERVRDGRTVVIRLRGEETEGGEAEGPAGDRVEVDLELLPPGAHEAGCSLTVWLAGGEFVHAEPHDEDDGGLLSRLFGR